jgi:uncharacterized protein (DUF1499 family)
MPSQRPSLAATIAAFSAGAGAVLAATGIVLAHFAVTTPFTGFRIFLLGGLGALLGLLIGAIGLLATRGGRSGRDRAWFGVVTGLLVVGAIFAGASRGRGLPRINDITTSPDDPPQFEVAARQDANRNRNMAYPGDFAAQQRTGYPDLAPIALDLPPVDAFERARRAAESLGWEIVESDPARGLIEARQSSFLFHFVDDIAIRVRAFGGGSVIDIRSKSRDGQGDMGVNAARIRAFAAELRSGGGTI